MGKKEYNKKYRETHKEKLQAYNREYYRKNFEKIAKRKHDKLVAEHKIMTPEEKAEKHRQAILRARERTIEWFRDLRGNPERLAKFNERATRKKREKYQNDPEFREHIRQYNKDRYKNNPKVREQIRERNRKYYQKKKEELNS